MREKWLLVAALLAVLTPLMVSSMVAQDLPEYAVTGEVLEDGTVQLEITSSEVSGWLTKETEADAFFVDEDKAVWLQFKAEAEDEHETDWLVISVEGLLVESLELNEDEGEVNLEISGTIPDITIGSTFEVAIGLQDPSIPTNTPVPTDTNTPLPPTATNTPLPPTATNTPLPPTDTNTPLPPTATNTPLPPTATNTPLPPTATNTPPPPTATNTPPP